VADPADAGLTSISLCRCGLRVQDGRVTTELPQLVVDDPWLVPHAGAIRSRMDRFAEALAGLGGTVEALIDHATIHHEAGPCLSGDSSDWQLREWAPAALGVSLIGDFNGWDRTAHPLAPVGDGMWELHLAGDALAHGQRIKLHVVGADGSCRDRVPACVRRAVQDPDTLDFSGQVWWSGVAYPWCHDFDPSAIGAPLIYEAHVGMSGEEPRVHGYREFAEQVLPRIARAGYNVVQLMAVQEHPYYGSFGYHVSSFFAPCSRFGTPEDLCFLIDTAHGLGLAVLLDIVHSHAVKNLAEGLNDFDGSGHQYFHEGARGDHPQWDSKCFDYGRPEVRRFLLSNVRHWLEEFRFDGFRFDGVTSMLYHSRGDRAFGSYDDYFGGDADEDAILYLQLATTLARGLKPGVLLVAEDMSGMPGLCRPVAEGGMGFTHRLAMGVPDHWIKLLKHQRDEDWDLGGLWGVLANRRRGEATIAYAESHDQALVGDKTLAFRLMDEAMYWHMAKDDPDPVVERGVALHKMIRLLTMVAGGEGWLNFMGNEFGHPEWIDFPREGNGWSSHHCRRQWSLVDDPALKYHWLADFDRAMIALARDARLLEAPPAECLRVDAGAGILVIGRAGLRIVFNFSVAASAFGYAVDVPAGAVWRVLLDSDDPRFGGHGRVDSAMDYPTGTDGALRIYLPARTALVFAPAG
jgi:1,4-alpha-glucan branching enzyme